MLNQNQIDVMIKQEFTKMQDCLNKMEIELIKDSDEFNQSVIAFHFGKLQEQYILVVSLLKIFTQVDKK